MSRRTTKSAFARRKTATQSRAVNTLGVILDAAAHILEVTGLEGYTTNAIAERAGVSIGSLYQYFPNKEAITLALIEREASRLVSEVQDAAEIADWRAALAGMIAAAVRHQLRHPALARVLDQEERRLPAADVAAPRTGPIFSAVCSVLARADVEHLVPVDRIAADLMALTRGITDMAGQAGELDAADLERRVSQAVFGYLCR